VSAAIEIKELRRDLDGLKYDNSALISQVLTKQEEISVKPVDLGQEALPRRTMSLD
jgi:hypothetical protein